METEEFLSYVENDFREKCKLIADELRFDPSMREDERRTAIHAVLIEIANHIIVKMSASLSKSTAMTLNRRLSQVIDDYCECQKSDPES